MRLARETSPRGLLGYSEKLQNQHEASASAESRKQKGQVFTPSSICEFMAGLFAVIPESFRILDAGAGVGSLTAALCERVLGLNSPRQIEAVLYENDPSLLPLLRDNMAHCQRVLEGAGHELRYTVQPSDFLLTTQVKRAQRTFFDDQDDQKPFDAAILNPPYFKIAADSPQARAMDDVFRGQSNIYMLFLARATELLRANGELVAITPRSFCNGLYFRNFRRWFFSRMALRHVHLFDCRRSTFDDVLQESMITHTQRLGAPVATTTLTTCHGRDIPSRMQKLELPASKILDDTAGDMVLRIPATAGDSAVMDVVEAWPDRFSETGLRVSTGPVVLFRAREFLLPKPDGQEFAPLLEQHNVKAFKTVWPIEKRGKPTAFRICEASLKHLVPAKNYVLLRRFSAKEEKRRLTASWILRGEVVGRYLALENHLNYVYHAERELSSTETYGLTALFNSALLDRYFRVISGNTQVNATEIRSIRFPDLGRVAAIGQRVSKLSNHEPATVEQIVLDVLGVNGNINAYLLDEAL